ncbi:MAG TPA: response regulator transcription factor [Tepidisphaeraceae bacterium]|nr:response regulator transcription factor [Tepidisphaeraceae bacterium]
MRVLVVEDFAPIRNAVVQGLREAGFAVDEALDGEQALWHAQSNEHDVIVLDLMLPQVDGLSVLKKLRERKCPAHILILTARDTTQDKVRGLELGADDYLVKPFHFTELLARVKALVRRKYEAKSTLLRFGDLEIDFSRRTVSRGGKPLDLSGREYALLEYLALNSDRIVSRNDIWQHVYDFNATPESNVVDVYIGRLRAKIERGDRPRLIHTRRGQGYILGERADPGDEP